MKLSETQWARVGLCLVVGLWSTLLLFLILLAPRVIGFEWTLAILGGLAIGSALYIYDARSEVPGE